MDRNVVHNVIANMLKIDGKRSTTPKTPFMQGHIPRLPVASSRIIDGIQNYECMYREVCLEDGGGGGGGKATEKNASEERHMEIARGGVER